MLRGLYSAAGGMATTAMAQDATSHNVSHATKPGFRREVMQFQAVYDEAEIAAPSASMVTDFSQGIMEYSGNKFDVAIDGPGFFTVQGPDGPLYTRSGVFEMNGQGQVVTPEGFKVLGEGGPIILPMDLNRDQLEILPDGSISAGGQVFDQLKLTTFQNPESLERAGSTMFARTDDTRISPVESQVRQGYRELGNTTIVQEMVQMISGARMFEAAQKALRQIGDTIAYNTRPR